MSDPITRGLHDLREECIAQAEPGRVADYIPELASPTRSVRRRAGQPRGRRLPGGRRGEPFTIQSVSKPFVYALALADKGSTRCSRASAPSPAASRSTPSASSRARAARQSDDQCRRHPDHLASSRAASSGSTPACRAFAGRKLEVDEAVYRRNATGDRNRAIAYSCARRVADRDVHDGVDAYFRQCSVLVTARDLANMAATLANCGANPDRRRVVSEDDRPARALA